MDPRGSCPGGFHEAWEGFCLIFEGLDYVHECLKLKLLDGEALSPGHEGVSDEILHAINQE